MNLEDLIATDELCERYKVEHTFIKSLSESGLMEIITIEHREYVPCERVAEFEKMRRLHYELNINMEGIEAVQHLLNQVIELQKMNLKLKNRLSLYE